MGLPNIKKPPSGGFFYVENSKIQYFTKSSLNIYDLLMLLRLLMLILVSTSAWGQLLVPLEPPSTKQSNRPANWVEELKFTPDMAPKPAMQITPPHLKDRKAPRRARKVVPKKPAPPKKQSIFSDVPILQQIPFLLDGTQKQVVSRLTGLANNLDSFFGEERADDELNRSRIRLAYAYTVYAEKKPIDNYAIRVNLRFPKLENKVKEFFLGAEDEEDQSSAEAKAKRKKEKKNPWIFRTDAGMNVSYPPIFFTRARLRKNWDLPIFIQRFIGELAWISDQGVIQSTTVNHDHDLTDDLLFRIVNEQDWFIEPKEFTTAHGPSFIHKITDDDGISYGFRVRSIIEDSTWFMDGYGFGIRYRRNLRNQWLYGEIGPSLDFPKSESFRRVPSIQFRIESLFGER